MKSQVFSARSYVYLDSNTQINLVLIGLILLGPAYFRISKDRPFLMVFLGNEHWINFKDVRRSLYSSGKISKSLHSSSYICQIEFNLFGNWQYLKIMYNSNHKSKVIIRLRLNMNFLANGGCFKDFPLNSCTLLAKSHFIPQVKFAKMPDWIHNFWQTT